MYNNEFLFHCHRHFRRSISIFHGYLSAKMKPKANQQTESFEKCLDGHTVHDKKKKKNKYGASPTSIEKTQGTLWRQSTGEKSVCYSFPLLQRNMAHAHQTARSASCCFYRSLKNCVQTDGLQKVDAKNWMFRSNIVSEVWVRKKKKYDVDTEGERQRHRTIPNKKKTKQQQTKARRQDTLREESWETI